jgi:hypothetical protein
MKLKNLMNAALIATAACLPTLQAEEAPKPASSNGGHQMGGMGAGMMGGMMMNDDRLKQMQEHLLKMHELSSKILAATDPKERDRLKAEQLELMKEHEKQHHMMMQQHMQEMMKSKGGMSGMQHGGSGAGSMGNMQHGEAPAAPAGQAPAPAAH